MQNRFISITNINQPITRFIAVTVKYDFASPRHESAYGRRVTMPLTINFDTSWK